MNFRRGKPFDIPEHPDELEQMMGWFFDQIRVMVRDENHHYKFDGITQILNILHDSRWQLDICIDFSEDDGMWNPEIIEPTTYLGYIIRRGTTEEDILNLPLVAIRFSRIYRHKANKYSNGENQSLEVLPNGTGTQIQT